MIEIDQVGNGATNGYKNNEKTLFLSIIHITYENGILNILRLILSQVI